MLSANDSAFLCFSFQPLSKGVMTVPDPWGDWEEAAQYAGAVPEFDLELEARQAIWSDSGEQFSGCSESEVDTGGWAEAKGGSLLAWPGGHWAGGKGCVQGVLCVCDPPSCGVKAVLAWGRLSVWGAGAWLCHHSSDPHVSSSEG